jgi:hypothetical protein
LWFAQAQEKSVPTKALEVYLKLARNDNCVAQLRLAQAYESGDLVKKNLTQSYFWLLLAGVDVKNRKADHVAYSVTSGISIDGNYFPRGPCDDALRSLREKIKAEETLPKKLVQAAQDAATDWTKGKIEKLLPPPLPPPDYCRRGQSARYEIKSAAESLYRVAGTGIFSEIGCTASRHYAYRLSIARSCKFVCAVSKSIIWNGSVAETRWRHICCAGRNKRRYYTGIWS